MAVTYATFIARFPVMAEVSQTLIEAELAAAASHCNAAVWGSKRDDGIAYLAAHRICIEGGSPKLSRLVDKDRTTTYIAEFKRMQRSLLVGDRVP